jgi:hypothetical protein
MEIEILSANMTIRERILKKYRAVSIATPGGEIYVESESALGIPADCERSDAAIIGVETFTITRGCTFPHLDGIADYSPRVECPWFEFRRRCNDAALNFMRKMKNDKGENIYFTFVIFDAARYAGAILGR